MPRGPAGGASRRALAVGARRKKSTKGQNLRQTANAPQRGPPRRAAGTVRTVRGRGSRAGGPAAQICAHMANWGARRARDRVVSAVPSDYSTLECRPYGADRQSTRWTPEVERKRWPVRACCVHLPAHVPASGGERISRIRPPDDARDASLPRGAACWLGSAWSRLFDFVSASLASVAVRHVHWRLSVIALRPFVQFECQLGGGSVSRGGDGSGRLLGAGC